MNLIFSLTTSPWPGNAKPCPNLSSVPWDIRQTIKPGVSDRSPQWKICGWFYPISDCMQNLSQGDYERYGQCQHGLDVYCSSPWQLLAWLHNWHEAVVERCVLMQWWYFSQFWRPWVGRWISGWSEDTKSRISGGSRVEDARTDREDTQPKLNHLAKSMQRQVIKCITVIQLKTIKAGILNKITTFRWI